jgi:hypothetical protein
MTNYFFFFFFEEGNRGDGKGQQTLISMLPILVCERRMGRPTKDGKMCAGKFEPANPHFTKPVPLSHTITCGEEEKRKKKRESDE